MSLIDFYSTSSTVDSISGLEQVQQYTYKTIRNEEGIGQPGQQLLTATVIVGRVGSRRKI